MFSLFFRIPIRNLWRKKSYSILNFACLTFGLVCTILAVLFILNIISFDKFHKNNKRIYTVESYVTYFNGDRFAKEYLEASLNDELKQQAPEIEELAHVLNRSYTFADGFPFVSGNRKQDHYLLVDFCIEWTTNIRNCVAHHKLANLVGCFKEPGRSYKI
jgi:hypothetical protein